MLFSEKFSFGKIATVSVDTGNVVILGWEFKRGVSSFEGKKDGGAGMVQW